MNSNEKTFNFTADVGSNTSRLLEVVALSGAIITGSMIIGLCLLLMI